MFDQEREHRRMRLASLVREYFGDDNDLVADVISAATSKNVTVRSVQTWLAPQARISSRNTPEWAIRALEDHINIPGNRDSLKSMAERINESKIGKTKSPREWGHEVRTNRSVEFAERELLGESRDRQALIDLAGRALGEALHQRFNALQREVASQASTIAMILRTFDNANSIEEVRAQLRDCALGHLVSSNAVREAKEALASGADEFSNDEGLSDDSVD